MYDNVSTPAAAPTPSQGPGMTRRRALGAAAAGAAALGISATGAGRAGAATTRAAATSVPVTYLTARAVVVGTGFGGGVSALRLAQAGVSTLVLERGISWPTGPDATTFCRYANMDQRSAWLTDQSIIPGVDKTWTPYTGVIEAVVGNNMTINCGAAVGGGSIVYHGMTLQPTEANFALSMPFAAGIYDELNAWAYPRVAGMLEIDTVPSDVDRKSVV